MSDNLFTDEEMEVIIEVKRVIDSGEEFIPILLVLNYSNALTRVLLEVLRMNMDMAEVIDGYKVLAKLN